MRYRVRGGALIGTSPFRFNIDWALEDDFEEHVN